MEVTTIGIDLAKYVFAVCGAESSGRLVMRRQLQACAGTHQRFMRGLPRCAWWGWRQAAARSGLGTRQFTALGHEVRLI